MFKGELEGDLEKDLKGDLKGDFRGDFKQDLEGDLLSISGQLRSRSGLVQVWFSIDLKFNSFELDSEVGRLVTGLLPHSAQYQRPQRSPDPAGHLPQLLLNKRFNCLSSFTNSQELIKHINEMSHA